MSLAMRTSVNVKCVCVCVCVNSYMPGGPAPCGRKELRGTSKRFEAAASGRDTHTHTHTHGHNRNQAEAMVRQCLEQLSYHS